MSFIKLTNLRALTVAMIVIASGFMVGCATSGPGVSTMAPVVGQYQYSCANGNKPVCTAYLGKQQSCSCANRREFERLLGGY